MMPLVCCVVCVFQVSRVDELDTPAHFPKAEVSFHLKELSVVWHFFGGEDFSTERGERRVRPMLSAKSAERGKSVL